MITPNELKQQAQNSWQHQSSLDWLSLPAKARATFAGLDIPTRKTEAWKYTPLTPLLNNAYLANQAAGDVDAGAAETRIGPLGDVSRLVFINGHFTPGLSRFSDLENQGIITLFSNANDTQRDLINAELGTGFEPKEHIFATLNYSSVADGLLIHAPADFKVQQAIQLVYLSTAEADTSLAQSRVLVCAEAGSSLELIEQFDSLGATNVFHNHMMEVSLHPNARMVHTRLQVEHESLTHINGLHIKLAQGSHYEQHALAFGSALKRNDINVSFNGNNAYCRLNGVFLSKHKQHIDNHLNLEHAAPHCNSDTEYKGFITDSSRAVFNGRIHIHQHAQKTAAHLNSKNLLLSKQAELDTKPELEIYADDVKCSHGASIGKLDDKSLFYFQSRGIDRATAEAMLCLGFVNEMVEQFPNGAVIELARQRLAEFFNDVDKLNNLWSLE
ncbi:MAG: Fe-S cluster assembly protein SufD [Pseudomonadales bacterium]|nr:Fe-S cluster assembly protein SufD [Pseudomonadales bacterium]HAG93730.1 Fe-S cluster assembly protein SufD [Gammaproteobacteria bacterium]MAQ23710.1 Fe-S cluster assembly protein SufD [Pseudomonadales bacterium]MAQ23966.1 Fe-S cluster assembly protein SufD [Pseudomonadales bacterium]HBO95159.1 Fe-S cluster assembly protein SufD [Gammaproteobacteria bacterium]|tara:strand:+ start:10323 stop:11651 length:1329 start_codon:yes stop_codon:yes gene_type:complete